MNREMGIITKKNKKEKEPAFFITETNIKALNYNVYYLSMKEKIIYFLIAFVVGAAVAYLFYGGIGKNEFGEATATTHKADIFICSIVGLVAGFISLPQREKQIMQNRKKKLKLQFRELLDSLSTSISSGRTVVDAFRGAYEDLQIVYTLDSYIVKELEIINTGMQNNINIELLLMDLGHRSAMDDILSFANVFDTCYRKGGNIKDVIKSTHQIISEKMEVEQKIDTIVTGSKTEQKIMMFMPVALIGIIKSMSPEFAQNFITVTGLISTTIAIILFISAYFIGKIILDIKI